MVRVVIVRDMSVYHILTHMRVSHKWHDFELYAWSDIVRFHKTLAIH